MYKISMKGSCVDLNGDLSKFVGDVRDFVNKVNYNSCKLGDIC